MADIKTKEKMVTIKLPRMKKDEPDEFVSVNKRTWQIQRGVSVQVPECVAEVFQHQEEMQAVIAVFDEQHMK